MRSCLSRVSVPRHGASARRVYRQTRRGYGAGASRFGRHRRGQDGSPAGRAADELQHLALHPSQCGHAGLRGRGGRRHLQRSGGSRLWCRCDLFWCHRLLCGWLRGSRADEGIRKLLVCLQRVEPHRHCFRNAESSTRKPLANFEAARRPDKAPKRDRRRAERQVGAAWRAGARSGRWWALLPHRLHVHEAERHGLCVAGAASMSSARWWCFVMANWTHIGWHRGFASAERELAPLLDVDVLMSVMRGLHKEAPSPLKEDSRAGKDKEERIYR